MSDLEDWGKLAEAMFPGIDKTPADYENMYPPRQLKDGARVTRMAPSPTGFLHLGTLFTSMVDKFTANASGGIFYFRLEDTDQKREVEGGAEDIINGLLTYGIQPEEGFVAYGKEIGDYGPYQQTKRAEIYQTYVKDLVKQGMAYPCFCSPEELSVVREKQEAEKFRTGYYGKFASCRNLSAADALAKIQAGLPYVVRLRSPGNEENRIKFDDMIKGAIEMPENDQDHVLLKTDGIPTYHFAHAVDDHLMRTTHVIRGDEWIASVPLHLQLFKVLGFKPPKYAHVSPIMKEEDGHKRKLSKRKDPEFAVHYFAEQGYPAQSIIEYLLTIANSDYEDWRRCNPDTSYTKFPFNLKKMSPSGALFDPDKLIDVSKNVIASMDAGTVADAVMTWAQEYQPALYELLNRDKAYTVGLFAIDRGGNKPRKDIAKWLDTVDYTAYFFDETFDPAFTLPDGMKPEDAVDILKTYKEVYDPSLDKQAWFDSIKAICPALGFCPEVKEYKKNPEAYKGHVGDVSTVIRLAVTGRRNTPDLCSILQLLGKERVCRRIDNAIALLEQRQ